MTQNVENPALARGASESDQWEPIDFQITSDTQNLQGFVEPEIPTGSQWKRSAKDLRKSRFTGTIIDDITIDQEEAWLIHRLLPIRGLAVVLGAPKAGKSFLLSDAMYKVAAGEPYAGRVTMQGTVVYCTGEGVNGFKRRLVVLRQHCQVEGKKVPFILIDEVPDLGSESDRDLEDFIEAIQRKVSELGLLPPRVVVLDTLARCMGSGDENSARDMGRLVRRCSTIEAAFRCAVVLVHHTGKDERRGARGSNALLGASDCEWIVEADRDTRRARVSQMKDGEAGESWEFKLEKVDGTCLVKILGEPTGDRPARAKKQKPMAGRGGDLLDILKTTIDALGTTENLSPAVPVKVRAVSREQLKEACLKRGWFEDPEKKTNRSILHSSLTTLRRNKCVDFDNMWVWLAHA